MTNPPARIEPWTAGCTAAPAPRIRWPARPPARDSARSGEPCQQWRSPPRANPRNLRERGQNPSRVKRAGCLPRGRTAVCPSRQAPVAWQHCAPCVCGIATRSGGGVLAVAPPEWMTTSRLRRLVRRRRDGWVGRWSGGHRWRAGPAKPAEVSQAHQHAAGVGALACERTGSGGPRSTEGDGALNVGGPRYGRVGGGLTGHRPVLRQAGGGRPPSRGRRRPWTRAASTGPRSPSHHR